MRITVTIKRSTTGRLTLSLAGKELYSAEDPGEYMSVIIPVELEDLREVIQEIEDKSQK